MPIKITLEKDKPLIPQIEKAMTIFIENGTFKAGTKVPGTREMARLLRVARKTVASAYERLIDKGTLQTSGRKGTFVSKQQAKIDSEQMGISPTNFGFRHFEAGPQILTPKGAPLDIRIDDGYPDFKRGPLIPITAAFRRAHHNMRSKDGEALLHGADQPQIIEELGKVLAQRGITINADNICFIRGCQMALYLIMQCLAKPGDQIALESPGNPFFRLSLEKSDADLVPIDVLHDGPDLDQLEAVAKNGRLKALVLYPQAQWPTTVAISQKKRNEIIKLSHRYTFAIVETDMDAEFSYDSDFILRMAAGTVEGNVIYLSCVSAMLPQLSFVNYVVGPAAFIKSLANLWNSIDKQRDQVMDRAIVELLKFGTLSRYQRKSVAAYRERRDQVAALIDQHLRRFVDFEIPDAGLAFWLRFRKTLDVDELVNRLYQRGVSVVPPSGYYFKGQAPTGLRIGFASPDLQKLDTALETLLKEIENMKMPV